MACMAVVTLALAHFFWRSLMFYRPSQGVGINGYCPDFVISWLALCGG
jgi:hypothetical protein